MSGSEKESNHSRKAARQVYVQVFLVFLLFLLMVTSTSFFMSRTLNNRLKEHVDDTVNWIQTSISNALLKPASSLDFISDNIQNMLRRGESFESVKDYIESCFAPEYKERLHNFTSGLYGYFEDLNAFYHSGGWMPAEEDHFIPRERPWYKAAVETGGKIALVPPYVNMNRTAVVAYSRLLTDEQGQPLGVMGMDVPLTFIEEFITARHITENGFGWLMDENMVFIIHQKAEDFLNRSMYEMPRFAGIVDTLRRNSAVSMQKFLNFREEKSLMFCRRLDNGWYAGLVIPEADYYRDMYTMIWVISVLGLLAAALLSIILVRLDKAKRKADSENRQKSDFLATVSHEIRTPMNTILGITEMQLHEEHLPNNVKEAFDRIFYSGDLLLSIINDLLDLSKIEAGKLEIKPARYEVASLLDEVIQINKLRYASSPLEFKLLIGENVPEMLVGDELRIKQVLNNLISNAYKYTSEGEIVLSVNAETEEGGEGGVRLILSVSDTGQGMTADQIGRLYEKFARFNSDTTRRTEGAGLGMSITRSLVSMMNGSITVESDPGKGSAFTVTLPQRLNGSRSVLGREVEDNLNQRRITSAAQVKKTQIIRKYMPYGSVLIVDDTEANLYVAKLLMIPYGLKIDTAESGYEAINKIKAGKVYDIVFMDHMMPGMDGMEAVKIIRNTGYSRPIIALTANAVVGQADIFLANGFDDFISKPIDMRMLDKALNEYIYDKQTPEALASAERERAAIEAQAVEARQSSPGGSLSFDIPVLNVGRGLAFFEGDEETYRGALRSFINNVPEVLDKLRVVTEESLPEYGINVHGLKSISGWICADSVRTRAESLEMLAKTGNFAGVTTLNSVLLNETEDFIKELHDQLGET